MRDFTKSSVWEKAHHMTLKVYAATRDFPREELYGLTSQMRRSSASVPANIAEGCGRNGDAELGRFLQIAAGSASELQYHFLLAHDLRLLPEAIYHDLDARVREVKRMLTSLIQRLTQSRSKPDRQEPDCY
jgi:four helix bundle protein